MTGEPKPITSVLTRRWDSLDALRGVSAFLVVTFHCAQVPIGFAASHNPLRLSAWLDAWTWLKFTPLRLLVVGPPAVVVFFVLSGFVLSLPFLRSERKPTYAEFAIKRLCRIYPPFAAAILLSALLYGLVAPSPIPGLSNWFNTVLWDRPLSLDYIGRNLMMTGLHPDMTLDLVMWSLVHELRISMVFPLLFVLTRRWPLASAIASLSAGVICTAILAGHDATDFRTSLIDTARFIPLFVAGIIVAGNVGAIRSAVALIGGKKISLFWLASVALLLAPGPSVSNYYDYIWGAGAVGVIMLIVGSSRADRLFSAAPLVWLGRVSYSLYLIHVPVLVAAGHLAYGRLPLWLTIALTIGLSLACAELMYRFVEKPSITLGRRLTDPSRYRDHLAVATVRPTFRGGSL